MAWFTPEELPNNRYYIFGKGGAAKYATEAGVDVLGEVPIIQSIMEGSDEGRPATGFDERVEKYYADIAAKVVDKLPTEC
jgi:ATP-binding protein involved in chromosome partitioning